MSDLEGANPDFLNQHAALDARLRALGGQVLENMQPGARAPSG